MNKKLYISILSTVFASSLAFAQEPQVTGKLTVETAKYTKNGSNVGTTTEHGNDRFKSETNARIYMDGESDINGGSTYHIELQAFNDGKAVGEHDSNDAYTQRDPLREAYMDTTVGDWNLRLGKQQVVWGTADGMKLLDMINPTDYSEMAQNQMEDSRIPVWMINAEKPLEDGGTFQFIVSQPKENVFAGLDRNIDTNVKDNGTSQLATTFDGPNDWGDLSSNVVGYNYAMDTTDVSNAAGTKGHSEGHPFILKGVDSITGKSNGFTNIVPDMGSVASRFYNEFAQTGVNTLQGGNYITVGEFAEMSAAQVATYFGANYQTINAFASGYGFDGTQILGGFASAYDTNLMNASSASTYAANQDSTFEYMDNATFKTFDAFAGAKSQYVYNMPDDEADIAMRYSNTTKDGTNYSLNYAYAYDKNPIINLSWRNDAGQKLTQNYTHGTSSFAGLFGRPTATTSIHLTDADGNRYGAYGDSGTSAGAATLRFEQTVERIHNVGGSFDTTIETEQLGPIVVRGEAVYQKDTYSPVMDLTALSIGDLPNALKMEKGDRFKYVIGADVTALTNMMVSLQFIQDRNLDYVDAPSTIDGNSAIASRGRFTTDYATMSLTNGFNKAEKEKDFYSLFLSKPFGESGQHRWNNIFIFEENGGKWNRLDAEFTVDDNTVATVEYNKYWGDENTQFGQLENSSNVQVGFKYSF